MPVVNVDMCSACGKFGHVQYLSKIKTRAVPIVNVEMCSPMVNVDKYSAYGKCRHVQCLW